MSYEVWVSFFVASLILCFTPGPTVLVVIGQSVKHGRSSAIPLVLGVLLGDIIAMTLSLIGLGALLASSSMLFNFVKWAGAIYLFYLGYKSWTQVPTAQNTEFAAAKKSSLFTEAMVVTALNPKGIMFFVAFFPLFIDPAKELVPQLAALIVTILFLSAASVLFFALGAGHLSVKLRCERMQKRFNRTSGSMLIGAGLMTALLNQ